MRPQSDGKAMSFVRNAFCLILLISLSFGMRADSWLQFWLAGGYKIAEKQPEEKEFKPSEAKEKTKFSDSDFLPIAGGFLVGSGPEVLLRNHIGGCEFIGHKRLVVFVKEKLYLLFHQFKTDLAVL